MMRLFVFLTASLSGLAYSAATDDSKSGPPQAPAAVQTCAACHGAQGEGNASTGAPRIAGQPAQYLAKQLESYVNGSRRNPLMEPIAKGLAPADRGAVAAYYAQLGPGAAGQAPPTSQNTAQKTTQSTSQNTTQNERGSTLATRGDEQRRVQGCINCHGPGGIGEAPGIPYLAGLDANYLAAALNAWKQGTRRNDAGQQMATVAQALAPDDVTAVAQFYAALSPPKPAASNVVEEPQRGGTDTSKGTLTESAGPHSNVGVEQGAPTTGGTQGPGGTAESKVRSGPNAPPGAAKGAPAK